MKVVKDSKSAKRVENRMISGLSSSDSKVVVKTIKYARKNADASHLHMLVELLRETNDDTVSAELISLLNDLKDQECMAPLMDEILHEKNKSIQIFLLQSIWNSRLDALDHLESLVDLAISSDYMTCLECLTIIENLETAPSDESIANVNSILKDALLDNSENKDLLLAMMETLNNFMIG